MLEECSRRTDATKNRANSPPAATRAVGARSGCKGRLMAFLSGSRLTSRIGKLRNGASGIGRSTAKKMPHLRDALEHFIADARANGRSEDTIKKYRVDKKEVQKFSGRFPCVRFPWMTFFAIPGVWKTANITASKRSNGCAAFFSFCIARGWIEEKPCSRAHSSQRKSPADASLLRGRVGKNSLGR